MPRKTPLNTIKMKPNAKLALIVGSAPIVRTEITRKLWKYIKRHKLQDPKDGRVIILDAKLKKIYGNKTKMSMFELNKYQEKNWF